MAEYTPMMQEYLKTKAEYEDCILFYRLGDFYEMFFEDAKEASRVLELTLTGKSCGAEEKAPMCGVPFHSADTYINRLVARGYKVAICEQVEDPKEAKGLVKREVIRVVTPGTNIDQLALDEGSNNYIMSLIYNKGIFGIASCDVSTADFFLTEVDSTRKLIDELYRFNPAEIIYNKSLYESGIDITDVAEKLTCSLTQLDESYFDDALTTREVLTHYKAHSLEGLGLIDFSVGKTSAGALLIYLKETQKSELSHLTHITPYTDGKFMLIDSSTRRNLELTETMRDKQKRGSLLWVLDKTKTAMGARKLRKFVDQPLLSKERILDRYDAIEALNNDLMTRDEMREYLSAIYDLERLMTRISIKTANPRDLLSFKNSLKYLPYIKDLISNLKGNIFRSIYEDYDTLDDIYDTLEAAISEDAPLTIKEGGIFKDGFSKQIDDFKLRKSNSKNLLAELEEKERQNSGIKNLKIKFNKVFGYYFEVTNSYKDMVPDYFIRKQTLSNAERFTTAELNDLSDEILNAEDKLYALEYEVYTELRDDIASKTVRVQKMAEYIAEIDALASLSYVAVKNHYVRPEINDNGIIDIKDGRHPVVELVTGDDSFIPNDTFLDNQGNRISIITGPNMAGKSTYMRQTAIITLMAQVGSFVPAKEASISLCDRIFTRVGASDDLAQGQSTFMVEMSEVANILRNATKDSLIILDEIGRGTSTFDGLSIAWAVVEYIADNDLLGAKTLFATHYHELTELEGKLSSVNNYCIAIKQDRDSIVFLRKIIKGGADRSYGIEVAKLAGVPDLVINRAREISALLEEEDITGNAKNIEVKSLKKKDKNDEDGQLSLFASPEEMSITAEIKAMDLNNMTPVKAMLYLSELKERLK